MYNILKKIIKWERKEKYYETIETYISLSFIV